MIASLLLAAQVAAASPVSDRNPDEAIVVTATALRPVPQDRAPASVTVIDEDRIEALSQPLTLDLLRLAPGVTVATAGPPGTQTQVRIRGAEANHTLLLIDGIRFNDPASGNEPRFELLNNEGVRRIEVVRGPQSALFGAESIGGVVSLSTLPSLDGVTGSALAELGSHDFFRGAVQAGFGGNGRSLGLYGGFQRSGGIDSVGQGGERDGYENATVGGAAQVQASELVSFRFAGRYVNAISEFDGSDPRTFRRANTLDESHNNIGAIRVSADISPSDRLAITLGAGALDSTNRNRRNGQRLNRTAGERRGLDGLVSYDFALGGGEHRVILGGDYENEEFEARDQSFGGATNQDRSRDRAAIVGEWQASFADRLTLDLALRHDSFEGFKDATTVRGSAIARLFGPVYAFASYGEGIARPNFFELFGFFPGNFVGNPDLKPERSRSYEAGARVRADGFDLDVTAYRQRLTDEIVGVFNSTTFLSSTANATGRSRRDGVDVEANWRPTGNISLSATYAFVDAEEQQVREGTLLREVRRARHSGSLAADGRWGPLSGGLSLAYVGKRQDVDFDLFPARRVTLSDYALLNARIAYRLTDRIEVFGRVANALDEEYQDVVGYSTPGRTAYAGLQLLFGD